MGTVIADTHAAVWFLLRSERLSGPAREALRQASRDGDAICLSAISIVEVVYLVEKERLPEEALGSMTTAVRNGLLAIVPLDLNTGQAVRRIPRTAVPDMPDRIIAATALSMGLPLVTRDRRIRTAGIETIW